MPSSPNQLARLRQFGTERYADIINLAPPTLSDHPSMPHDKRAACFSPFAALGKDNLQKDEG